MVQKPDCCQTVRRSKEAPSPERTLPWKTVALTNCERSWITCSSSKPKFWNHEALARPLIPKFSNTKSGKKSFTTFAMNSLTPLRCSAQHAAADVFVKSRLRIGDRGELFLRARPLRSGGDLTASLSWSFATTAYSGPPEQPHRSCPV